LKESNNPFIHVNGLLMHGSLHDRRLRRVTFQFEFLIKLTMRV
jgi:hypothetical protein